jgi:NDP-sugar pyrophosphorylase family protein
MKVIIPLCGKGQRFKDAGYTVDKPFIDIFGRPLIQNVFDMFINEEVYVFTNLKHDLFDFAPSNVTIVNIPQETKGAVETLWLGLSKVDIEGECLIVDGDAFYTCDIISKCRSLTSNGVVYFETKNEKPVFSYIEMDTHNTITKIREKEKISNNANTGAYFFKQASVLKTYCKIVLDQNITFRGEPYISCLIDKMLSNKYHFTGIQIDPMCFKCLGTPDQLKTYISSTYGFLFDLDGTLVNTDSLYENVWSQLLKPFGIAMTSELYKTFIYSNSDWYVYQSLLSNIEDIDMTFAFSYCQKPFLPFFLLLKMLHHQS